MAKTCTIITPAASRDHASETLAAFWGDDPGSQEFTVALSADGQEPATHYALSIPQNQANAAKIIALRDNGGTLPAGLNLNGYNVTTQEATAAMGALVGVSAIDCSLGSATDHLNAQLDVLGLQRIIS